MKFKKIARHAIYFDWRLNIRAGGPPGYLENLRLGLEDAGLSDHVAWVTADPNDGGRDDINIIKTPLIQSSNFIQNNLDLKEIKDKINFLARHDWLHIQSEKLMKLDAPSRRSVHVHTTIDALKMHNTLTKHGLRHRIKLVLSSHSPEAPCKEWAEIEYNKGIPTDIVDLYYNHYKEIDYLAFHAADVLIFPCENATDPYLSTMDGFQKTFRHKDVRYVCTGVQDMQQVKSGYNFRSYHDLQGKFVCCYIGRHNVVKGYDVLCSVGAAVLERCNDVAFLVGGHRGPLPPVDHERWIECGWTEKPADLIDASDVFILPNQQTYFDLILLEVLSLGKIVIASRTGGNKYFEGKSAGIFLYDDPQELYRIILRLREMSNGERASLGSQNRSLYEHQFTLKKFAESYVTVVESIHSDYNIIEKNDEARNIPTKLVQEEICLNNKPEPRISVILPVYNAGNSLRECLMSVIQQTFDDIEIIVVNDGSNDETAEIISEIGKIDDRIVVISQKNGGLSAARNTGLAAARGEFIAFIDSDDAYSADMLEKLICSCIKNNTLVGVCGVMHVNADNKASAHTSFIEDDKVYPFWSDGVISSNIQTVSSIYPSAWNKIYHRSLFKNIRYDVGLHFEDHPVFYKIFLNIEKFSYVNEPLYFHRDSGIKRITRDGSRRVLDIFVIIDIVESIFRSHSLVPDVRWAMSRIILRLVWERSWVVFDQDLKFLLMENAVMRFSSWGLSRGEIERNKDYVIESNFIDEMYSVAGQNGGWESCNKRKYIMGSRISVVDRSKIIGSFDFPMVCYEENEAFILVHPQPDCVTIAQVTGAYFWGKGKLRISVCTENHQASAVEFRVLVAPFVILDMKDVNAEDSSHWCGKSAWVTLNPAQPMEIEISVEYGVPTMALYFCTRIPQGGSSHYAWTRVRNIQLHSLSDKHD